MKREKTFADFVDVINCELGEQLPVIEQVRIVPLETTDKSLLGEISNIAYFNDRFIVQSNDRLYVFDGNGKFLCTAGMQGRGPGEYLRLNAFYVCDEGISIIDQVLGGVLSYSFDGRFLEFRELPDKSANWSYRAIAVNYNEILLAHMINFEDDVAFSFVDMEKSTSTKLASNLASTTNYGFSASSNPMTKYGDRISFTLPLDNVIYKYRNGDVQPRYVVNTPFKEVNDKEIKDIEKFDSSAIRELGKRDKFTGFRGIFETDKFLILGYHNGRIPGYFFVDKSKLEGKLHLREGYNLSELRQYHFYNTIGVADESFIAACPATEIIESLSYEFETPIIYDKAIVDKLDENSNPCLILYEMKGYTADKD